MEPTAGYDTSPPVSPALPIEPSGLTASQDTVDKVWQNEASRAEEGKLRDIGPRIHNPHLLQDGAQKWFLLQKT